MVALEAMACGTPVIASRVGGLALTVRDGETGFLVPERDPEALAEKLELVLTDPRLRARLARRAVQVARDYSWDVVADDVEQLYGELGAWPKTLRNDPVRAECSAKPVLCPDSGGAKPQSNLARVSCR